MSKQQVKIVDVLTGEEIIRDASAEEIKRFEKEAADAVTVQAEAEAKAQAKAAAETKLAAIGLTTNDLRALGL